MDYKLKYLKYKKKYLALKNSKLKGQGSDLEIDFSGQELILTKDKIMYTPLNNTLNNNKEEGNKLFTLKKNKYIDEPIDKIKKKDTIKINKLDYDKFKKSDIDEKQKKLNLLDKILSKAITFSFKFKCVSGNCKDGYGTLKSNKGKYVGQIKNNLPNGEGIFTENYGPVYKSIWKNGLIMDGLTSVEFNGKKLVVL